MKDARKPPAVGWFVIEVDVEADRNTPVQSFLNGPFPTREKAEHERDEKRKAWQRALEEFDGQNPYDYKDFSVVKHNLSDRQLGNLERMDGESYEIMMDAVNAVGASIMAEETGMDVEELIDE